jgi:predicted lipase
VYVGFDAPRFMIVVAFRGSKTLANWINDMRFAHVDTPFPACSGCFLHKGFITSYNSIAVPLFVAVAQLRAQYNTTRIMVTGHSLGGALAQLAALDLTVHDEFAALTPLLYTFGSPRIGNNNFQLCAHALPPCVFVTLLSATCRARRWGGAW